MAKQVYWLSDAEWLWEPLADDRVTLRWRMQHIVEFLRAERPDVVLSGTHYYTVSYSPTNANWNGAYRHIKINVGPVLPVTAWDKFIAWLNPLNGKVLYRDGYFARNHPERPTPSSSSPCQRSCGATSSPPG